jgi:hypothetical protein
MDIYMRDEISLWHLHGFQVSIEDLIKVAEGIR